MGLNPLTMFLLLVLGVLLFGKRLPEMAKQIGKGVLEFKNGMADTGESLSVRLADKKSEENEAEKRETSASRFEPPA